MRQPVYKGFKVIVLLVVAISVGIGAFIVWDTNCRLGEWHSLQKLEYAWRKVPMPSGMFLTHYDGRHFVCKVSPSNKIWLLLDPRCYPTIKRLPEMDVALVSVELSNVLSAPRVHHDVKEYLVRNKIDDF